MANLIVRAQVRKVAHENGKKVAEGFLHQMEMHVHRLIVLACAVHDGGRKTLDRDVLIAVERR